MKRIHFYLFVVVLFAMMAIACTEEVPMTFILGSNQLTVEGKSSGLVHPDTTSIFLGRDSVADEKHDTLYTIHTSIDLILDSLYTTDQMEGIPQLELRNGEGKTVATLNPVDSLLRDSLVVFLNKKPGSLKRIAFEGQIGRTALMQLRENPSIAFTGFTFCFADPKITEQLNLYSKYLQAIRDVLKEAGLYKDSARNSINAGFGGLIYAMIIGQALAKTEELDKQIRAKKDKMSPLQLARYEVYHKELKSYNMNR